MRGLFRELMEIFLDRECRHEEAVPPVTGLFLSVALAREDSGLLHWILRIVVGFILRRHLEQFLAHPHHIINHFLWNSMVDYLHESIETRVMTFADASGTTTLML